MTEHISNPSSQDNIVDKAANATTKAVDATKSAANAALDSMSNKVESVRSNLSPKLDSALSPLDSVLSFTREQPLAAISGSFAIGFVLAMITMPSRRRGGY